MNRADGEPGNSKQGTKRNRNEADLTKTDKSGKWQPQKPTQQFFIRS